jgi:DNA-binding winged helix-turn-helix (wHTH) protein
MRLRFDEFELDGEVGCLLRDGREVPLERRVFELLSYVATRPGQLISKAELIQQVWHVQTLSDGVLANAANKLRKALGQAATARSPLETVYGRGYRFHLPPERMRDPFVGRDDAMARVQSAMRDVRGGQGRFVLLVGEAGIGKSRLVSECARADSELSLWQGAAHDGSASAPYGPWIELLRAAGGELRAWRPSALAQLAFDEKQGRRAPASMRTQLFADLPQFLAHVSRGAPRMLVLEDLHWSDRGTLELLAHAARTLAAHRVLLVATLREDEARTSLPALSRDAEVISLRALSTSQVAELTQALWSEVPPQQLASISARAGGNPFFVRQLVQLARHGSHDDLPHAVRDLASQRLAALPAAAVEALEAASVIGSDFDPHSLAALMGGCSIELLEPALRARLITPHAAGFRFAHALMRDACYERLSMSARGAHHHALARLPHDGTTAQRLARAHHALAALPFDVELTIEYARAAADAARADAGFESAAAILERTLEKLTHASEHGPVRCELALALAGDCYGAGDIEAAWRVLEPYTQLARSLGRGDWLARMAFVMLDCLEAGAGDEGIARAALTQALALLGDGHPELRAALIAHRAELSFERSFEERCAELDRAEQLAAQAAVHELQLEVATCRVNLRHPLHNTESQRASERLRTLCERGPVTPRHALHSYAAEVSD